MFNQLQITNKMERYILKVGMPCSCEAYKGRLAYSVTATFKSFIIKVHTGVF